MEIFTTHSDEYIDVIPFNQEGFVLPLDNAWFKVRVYVGDDYLEASYNNWDGYKQYDYCESTPHTVMMDMVYDATEGAYRLPRPDDDPNNITNVGVDCISVFIPKYTFDRGGVVKVAICKIDPDSNFQDNDQEVWGLEQVTNIKYVYRE